MAPTLTASSAPLQMKCPSCGSELGNFPTLENASVKCPKCDYSIFWDGTCWDACVDKSYPRSFARQWVLWEEGKLGDPNLVYGNDPKEYFRELLETTSLTEEDLKTVLREAGLDVAWTILLQDERILFFHNTAPWLALMFKDGETDSPELLIVRENVKTLDDPETFARLADYNRIYSGLANALDKLQQHIVAEIHRYEKSGERSGQ